MTAASSFLKTTNQPHSERSSTKAAQAAPSALAATAIPGDKKANENELRHKISLTEAMPQHSRSESPQPTGATRPANERSPTAQQDHAVVLLGSRLEVHASDLEGKVREGSAAFGRLAELATRRATKNNRNNCRGAPALCQEEQPRSSLPRRLLFPGGLCMPPYSRQWLLDHRAQSRGSPLRPSSVVPRGPEEGTAAAAKPPPKFDKEHTPDSVQSLLAALEKTPSRSG